MNEQQLFTENGEPANTWFCGKCKRVSPSKVFAVKCCEPFLCKCGNEGRRMYGHGTECSDCTNERLRVEEGERYLAAETVDIKTYQGFIYDEGGRGSQDGYFESLDDLLNSYEEESEALPSYVYCCKPRLHTLDIESAIETMCDDGYEDMQMGIHIPPYLNEALDRFHKENEKVLTSYFVDYTRKIILGH